MSRDLIRLADDVMAGAVAHKQTRLWRVLTFAGSAVRIEHYAGRLEGAPNRTHGIGIRGMIRILHPYYDGKLHM